MSTIQDIIDHPELVLPMLDEYEKELIDVADILAINENQLKKANIDNATWHLYYDQKRVELLSLVKHFEIQQKVARSILYVSYTNTFARDLTESGKEKYIDGEPAFLAANSVLLQAKEIYEKYHAVCTAFQTRGYAINNLVKLAIAEIEDLTY